MATKTPFEKLNPKAQAYQFLRFGDIRPAGWMHAQMLRDLEHGFVGHLDELVPDLIQKDDIYGADRLTHAVRSKNLGVVSKEMQWEAQYLWWNSETQSNWWDGMARTALVLEQTQFIAKVRARIDYILSSQDPDGYLGIYAPDLRYNFTGENGELWAQASLFRMLLGYYEFTGEQRVLEAVRRAVDVTMRAYPLRKSGPFTVEGDLAGVGHGLVFSDVLERLYQLTGRTGYLDYALWLYEEYSRNNLSQDDIQFAHLVDPAYRFKAHGAHTYEHLRSLLTAVYASGNPLLEEALEAYLEKLELCLTPSGGPIGDEFIAGRLADASETGYEYCSIHELLDSYSHLLQKNGSPSWADRMEWLLFNAGQGARHPTESTIAYLKTDNSYSMTGSLHPDDPVAAKNPQTRYKYSPVHQDVAVCCAPNAGRIHPYYIKSMWMAAPQGLTAMLYGPCDLQTDVNGTPVRISEKTNYPFDLEITFKLEVAQPVAFDLGFRKPSWADEFILWGDYTCREENGVIILHKTWQSGDIIHLRFETNVKVNRFAEGEYFLSYGSLVFALPLESDAKEGRKYPLEGFRDIYYLPLGNPDTELQLVNGLPFTLERGEFDPERPWGSALKLVGELFAPSSQKTRFVRLIPMGGSILRKVTFGSAVTDSSSGVKVIG